VSSELETLKAENESLKQEYERRVKGLVEALEKMAKLKVPYNDRFGVYHHDQYYAGKDLMLTLALEQWRKGNE
jgi:Holliday junction resolvasome RuvABC ATP-dependent DNA helicase subunit